jgi:hypothetical protein
VTIRKASKACTSGHQMQLAHGGQQLFGHFYVAHAVSSRLETSSGKPLIIKW